MVEYTLEVIFLVSRRDTPNPKCSTSDPDDTTFGSIRVVIQEMIYFIGNIELKIKSMYEINIDGAIS